MKSKSLRHYISAQFLWQIGLWTLNNAFALLVFDMTDHTAKSLGCLSLASAIGMIIGSVSFSDIADRKSKVSIFTFLKVMQIAGAAFIAFMLFSGILKELNQYKIWGTIITSGTLVVYAISFINGVLLSIYYPTNQLFLSDIVGMNQLKKAVSVNSIVVNACRFLGPALAAFLISWFSFASAFAFACLFFLPVGIVLSKVKHKDKPQKKAQDEQKHQKSLLSIISRDYRILGFFFINVLIGFFCFSIIMLAPAIAHGNAADTGRLLTSSGIASILSLLFVIPFVSSHRRTGKMISYAAIWAFMWLTLLSVNESIRWGMVCFFFAGFGTTIIMVSSLGNIQVLAPPSYRAKLLSALNITIFAAQPIATISLGYLADIFGILLIVNATAMTGLILSLLLFLSFKKWRKWATE